ncbi:caspase-1-like isoform X2 [Ostrinia nubilalis]|uniref:caspase-1-like isoform X2 n=1 Tax=Ostrinia nubilalis TaxID=29057 RepID=UPI0030825E52
MDEVIENMDMSNPSHSGYSTSDALPFNIPTNLINNSGPGEETGNPVPPDPGSSEEPNDPSPIRFDPDSTIYDLSGKKEMIVFTNTRYDKEFYGRRPPDHGGFEEDFEILDDAFSSFGFKLIQHKNKTYLEIIDIINEKIKEAQPWTSCLAFVIMTHGNWNGELGAYDRYYELKNIYELFEKAHISLTHRPKLFFIKAKHFEFKFIPAIESGRQNEDCPFGRTAADDNKTGRLVHTASHVEFLQAISIMEENISESVDSRSWFVRDFCDVLQAHHHEMDLSQMLTRTTNKMAFRPVENSSPPHSLLRGPPKTTSTLTKLLVFDSVLPYFNKKHDLLRHCSVRNVTVPTSKIILRQDSVVQQLLCQRALIYKF